MKTDDQVVEKLVRPSGVRTEVERIEHEESVPAGATPKACREAGYASAKIPSEIEQFQRDLLASVKQMRRGQAARVTKVSATPSSTEWPYFGNGTRVSYGYCPKRP